MHASTYSLQQFQFAELEIESKTTQLANMFAALQLIGQTLPPKKNHELN